MTAVSAPTVGLMKSWRDAPWDAERWPHFTAKEFACKCKKHCQGEYFHDPEFLDGLELMRADAGQPLIINSGHRCLKHNRDEGGAVESMHLTIAADIRLAGHNPAALARSAQRRGFTGIGFGHSFLHVDRRSGRAVGFHYPGGAQAWLTRFGFDPAKRVTARQPL